MIRSEQRSANGTQNMTRSCAWAARGLLSLLLLIWVAMAWRDRGVQMLLATIGAFLAFSLMSIAIGTDYWLYSRAYICNATNSTSDETQTQPKKVRGDLTHSGLWRICCIEGIGLLYALFKERRKFIILGSCAMETERLGGEAFVPHPKWSQNTDA